MADIAADPRPAGFAGFGTKGYRAYVLGLLLAVYIFNFIDRIVISIVQEPIKAEFSLSDTQLGLMQGLAFALLYTLLGIPIARIAEKKNRTTILAVCIALWSVMTALCGMATSYATLLAARIGVGIGEAGCTPPAQSVIGDYFPADKRASAISIYSLGVPVGSMFAAFGGGMLLMHFGWREAFLVLGLPGLFLAILVKLTLKEPPRSQTASETPSLKEALAILAKKPTFWHLALGAALAAWVGYGVINFTNSFMIRVHHLDYGQASRISGVLIGLFGGLGTFLSGFIADRIAHRHPNAIAWLPILGFLISTPLTIAGFTVGNLYIAVPLLAAGALSQYFYLAPQYAITQAIVAPRMRATAIAILLFVINLIGYGLGPLMVGWMSDQFANMALAGQGLSVEACKTAIDVQKAACAAGSATGLRHALQVGALVFLWAALHYGFAWKHMSKDLHR